MHSDPKYPLQLRRLQVRVENILKGDVSRGTVAVYYFTFAGEFDGPRPLGMWSVESRRILWLRREAGARHATGGTDAPGKCTAALTLISQSLTKSQLTMPWLISC